MMTITATATRMNGGLTLAGLLGHRSIRVGEPMHGPPWPENTSYVSLLFNQHDLRAPVAMDGQLMSSSMTSPSSQGNLAQPCRLSIFFFSHHLSIARFRSEMMVALISPPPRRSGNRKRFSTNGWDRRENHIRRYRRPP